MSSPIGNRFVMAIANSPLNAMLGKSVGVITVEGRKTHKSISTPINVVMDGDSYIVTSLKSRQWWRNLRGGQTAWLRVAGKSQQVQGDVFENRDEVSAGLKDFFTRYPAYAKFYRVRLGADGQPSGEDIQHIAEERVLIRLRQVKAQ